MRGERFSQSLNCQRLAEFESLSVAANRMQRISNLALLVNAPWQTGLSTGLSSFRSREPFDTRINSCASFFKRSNVIG